MEGKLKKLTIQAYDSQDYSNKVGEFSVMFNPTNYRQKYEVEYEEAQGQGTSASPQVYGRIKPQEYNFELLFDGTGTATDKVVDVAQAIESFLTLTGKHQGEIHRPYYLKLSWGTLISDCVLKSAEITYSLFDPDGQPLRAKVNAMFSENVDETLRAAKENNSSPDLSHHWVIKDGDTLPLLCYRIYGDSAYYGEIARLNNLKNFRKLEAGATLRFPPLKQKSS